MNAHGPRVSSQQAGPRVVVVGSTNVDYVTRVARRPDVGETVAGEDLTVLPGGKGANQAVAAARSGAAVTFVGAVGDDVHGTMLLEALIRDGIDVTGVHRVPGASGSAVIVVGPDGDNSIIIIAGANAKVDDNLIMEESAQIGGASVCVLQGELSSAATTRAALSAAAAGVRVVLNLAPVIELPTEVLRVADPLVVNGHEAAHLLGLSAADVERDPGAAATRLHARGPLSVVITLGAEGSVVLDQDGVHSVPARVVDAVDSTGAGDAFVGALAESLAGNQALLSASTYATAYAALAVTRRGAQASYPTRFEAEEFVRTQVVKK
ncbi:ribokinase [Cellulomonas fimi]|uniref:Ribokinase n=1 Tax=Cellulomonas fimi TaxID=1708 RepID=A0A7Y0QGT8_CELFI|nr:ribokinase [Cellulomonas fimi]NMR19214.1 ribokinase [Cellulomonas fimi]